MSDPDTDPADILARVVDAIGNSLALFRVDEIVNLDFLRQSLGKPLTPVVFVVSDEFLLLGVDGNHRIAARLERLDLVVDVSELGIAIRMIAAFTGFGVCLQAVAQ